MMRTASERRSKSRARSGRHTPGGTVKTMRGLGAGARAASAARRCGSSSTTYTNRARQ